MSDIFGNWTDGAGLLDALVIDGHTHIGEWPHATTFRSAQEAAERSVAYLDGHGIDAACVLSGGYMSGATDYRKGNDFLLAVCDRAADRLIPFMSFNANDRREQIIAELDRIYAAGVRCIKLLNRYQEDYPGDGPTLMAVYEYAADRGMLILNHAWDAEVIMRIAEQFPQVDFICGHYGERYDPVLKARENVYANTWAWGNMGFLDRGVRAVGAHKFCMGSDGFLNPMSVGIGPVVFADVSDAEKRQILGLTQARLLDKVGALPDVLKDRLRSWSD